MSKDRQVICFRYVVIYILCLVGVMCCNVCNAEAKKMPLYRKTIKDVYLTRPEINYVGATSKGAIRIKWDKVSPKNYYVVYRAKKKKGTYKRIAVTMKDTYCDRTGKANVTYYYKVTALKWREAEHKWHESKLSKPKKAKVRKQAKKIAYVGDSITTGYSIYHIVGKDTRVFAQIGLHASRFYGSSLYQSLLQYNPDRMVMMFGMNSLPGNPSDAGMDVQTRAICSVIKQCKKKNPNMEIVIMGVSPVGRTASVRLASVRRFNAKLKKSIKAYKNVHYFEPANVLADGAGYLSREYGGGDGIHWSPNAYKKVYQAVNEFVLEWEQ
ncbi:MAG: GDSL-type esterase/lipase family protein [Eubacteriales bacterium]|nr:GDSL-type esterase/lipase family protein [Eubacteriales bacterium]